MERNLDEKRFDSGVKWGWVGLERGLGMMTEDGLRLSWRSEESTRLSGPPHRESGRRLRKVIFFPELNFLFAVMGIEPGTCHMASHSPAPQPAAPPTPPASLALNSCGILSWPHVLLPPGKDQPCPRLQPFFVSFSPVKSLGAFVNRTYF